MVKPDSNKEGDECLMFGSHPNANAGGAGPCNLDESSDDYFEDTDLMIDNISNLLKSCFRKNMAVGLHNAGGHHAHKRRRTECRSPSPDCKKATNRSNLAWFSDIIKQIPGDKKSVIENYGFSCCLYFDCSGVPRYFAQWIADHVQIGSTDVILDSGCLHLSVQALVVFVGSQVVHARCETSKRASFASTSSNPSRIMWVSLQMSDCYMYTVEVKAEDKTTILCGTKWEELAADYRLTLGDTLMFMFTKKNKHTFIIECTNKRGQHKCRLDKTVPFEAFNSIIDYKLADVVYSQGVSLSAEEADLLRDHIASVVAGASAFFVHRLTCTNLGGCLKFPNPYI